MQLRGVGIGERPERLLVLALVGMAGFLEYALVTPARMHTATRAYSKNPAIPTSAKTRSRSGLSPIPTPRNCTPEDSARRSCITDQK